MTRPRPARTREELLGMLMRQLHMHFSKQDQRIDGLPPTILDNYITTLKSLRDSVSISLDEREKILRTNPPPGMYFQKPPDDDEDDQPTEVHIITDVQEPVLSRATLNAIQAEATRAHIVHGDESMFGPHNSARRLAILLEEYGEAVEELDYLVRSVFLQMQLGKAMGKVAHELTYDSAETIVKLMVELNQVSAMSASWYEVLRRQLEGKPNGG